VRRILLLLAVAAMTAMMLVAYAMPAFAGSTQSAQFGSGNTGAQGSNSTPNCQGAGSSQFVSAGNDTGNPGSNAHPSLQFGTFNGPFTSDIAKANKGLQGLVPSSGNLTCPQTGQAGGPTA
jgi:hypothetical protein